MLILTARLRIVNASRVSLSSEIISFGDARRNSFYSKILGILMCAFDVEHHKSSSLYISCTLLVTDINT